MNYLIMLKIKLKKPLVYIPLGIFVVVAFFSFRSYQTKNKPPEYETTVVERGNLTQTVEATGKLESKDDVSLRFEIPGTLMTLNVKEGDQVKAGAVLASLRLSELNAAMAQASANLRQKQAGASEQDREYYRAAVDAAKATLEQTKIEVNTAITAAGAAANTAYNNLKLAEGGDNSQIVNEAYENGVATLQLTSAKLEDAINQSQAVLDYLSVIPPTDLPKKNNTDASLKLAAEAVVAAKIKNVGLTSFSQKIDIDAGFTITEPALSATIQALSKIADLLETTSSGNDTSRQTNLDNNKTIIATTRNSIAVQYSSFLIQRQAIMNAKNSYTTYSIAYQKSMRDLADTKAKADSTIQIKQAAHDQAVANYQSKILPTRWIDVAPYQAALAAAVANREKAIMRAPVDGIIAKINHKKGELVNSANSMIDMVSPHYEIKVDVPETDIAKMVSSTRREAEFTLDAVGEETKFKGTVININQQSTEIQDVVYYQVTIAVLDDQKNKPIQAGMTANVKILTDARDNVLWLPQRSIRTQDSGQKYVRILNEKNQEQEKNISIGLRADEGKIEITEGLNQGEKIIVTVKKK